MYIQKIYTLLVRLIYFYIFSDQRSRQLNEANERCVQLQEILNSKDAEVFKEFL